MIVVLAEDVALDAQDALLRQTRDMHARRAGAEIDQARVVRMRVIGGVMVVIVVMAAVMMVVRVVMRVIVWMWVVMIMRLLAFDAR